MNLPVRMVEQLDADRAELEEEYRAHEGRSLTRDEHVKRICADYLRRRARGEDVPLVGPAS